MLELFIDPKSWILLGMGIVLSFWGAIIGGSSFFYIGLLQLLFPGAGFGVIIGNQKCSGMGRGLASLIVLWKEIEWKKIFPLIAFASVGTIVGASIIAKLDPKWLFPAIIVAIFFSELAPKISKKFSKHHFLGASSALGIYNGFLGMGAGIVILALLRTQWPKSSDIMHLQIQKRIVIVILNIIAVIAHGLHGNLVLAMWFPFFIGNFIGGTASSYLLLHMRKLSGKTQQHFLYASFAFALFVAAWETFG
jgi:uncharacterized membrane protein YfcA